MKKLIFFLMLLLFSRLFADFGDIAGPTIGGAALGGIFGGRRGAAIGAGVGFGVGALNSAQKDRRRSYQRPVYYDEYGTPYHRAYTQSPRPRNYRVQEDQ